jgi:nicotinate-nucleotide adenylyltransferase
MIGIFGGCFDPVHYGHLKTASSIKKELGLTKIFLMPCAKPPHKNNLFFSPKQRLKMLEIAISEFKDLKIDDRELKNNTISWTIDSLKAIKQEYPNQLIYLIIGADSFNNLNTWKNYQEFNKYVKIVVLKRPKYKIKNTNDKDVYFAKTAMFDISSSDIRNRINENKSLSKLLPDKVINYIKTIK